MPPKKSSTAVVANVRIHASGDSVEVVKGNSPLELEYYFLSSAVERRGATSDLKQQQAWGYRYTLQCGTTNTWVIDTQLRSLTASQITQQVTFTRNESNSNESTSTPARFTLVTQPKSTTATMLNVQRSYATEAGSRSLAQLPHQSLSRAAVFDATDAGVVVGADDDDDDDEMQGAAPHAINDNVTSETAHENESTINDDHASVTATYEGNAADTVDIESNTEQERFLEYALFREDEMVVEDEADMEEYE